MKTCHFMSIVTLALVILFMTEVALPQDDYSEQIKRIEREIEKSKKELEKGEKKLEKLKSDEKKTLAALDHSEKELEAIDKNLRIIKNAEKTLNRKIAVAGKSHNAAKHNFEIRAETYSARLRSMYKRQNVSPMGMLFTVGSFSSVLRAFKMLSVLAAADLNVVNEIREQTRKIQASLNELQNALNAKATLAKAKQREKISLKNSSVKKQKVLEEILKDEKRQEAANRKYEQDYKNSQEILAKSRREYKEKKEKAKIPVPPSLEGYNFAQYRGKLPWPVNGKIVSTFGTVTDPLTKTVTKNRGIEIAAKHGDPVKAIGRGEVVMTQYLRGYGNFVMISHPPDYYTIYGHLSDVLVNTNDIVLEESVIGLAGTTGMIDNSSCRLVLEVLKGETPQNPVSWLRTDRQRAAR